MKIEDGSAPNQERTMQYYRYIPVFIIVPSIVLIGVGAGLAIPGLLFGGVLCLIVGAVMSALIGIRR